MIRKQLTKAIALTLSLLSVVQVGTVKVPNLANKLGFIEQAEAALSYTFEAVESGGVDPVNFPNNAASSIFDIVYLGDTTYYIFKAGGYLYIHYVSPNNSYTYSFGNKYLYSGSTSTPANIYITKVEDNRSDSSPTYKIHYKLTATSSGFNPTYGAVVLSENGCTSASTDGKDGLVSKNMTTVSQTKNTEGTSIGSVQTASDGRNYFITMTKQSGFDKYYDATTGYFKGQDNFSVIALDDSESDVKYNKYKHPITFKNVDGTTATTVNAPYGDTIDLTNIKPTSITEGKVFDYWALDGTKLDSSLSVTGTVSLTAVEAEASTVKFYNRKKQLIKTIEVKTGSSIVELASTFESLAEESGWKFDYWDNTEGITLDEITSNTSFFAVCIQSEGYEPITPKVDNPVLKVSKENSSNREDVTISIQ